MAHTDAKTRFALALRDALKTVPLSKVTVSGLTRAAGVTRQAFYYHFSDIRDLTAWVFKREVADQIVAHSTPENWSDGLLSMLVWMQAHPQETRSVVSSLTMDELQVFLHRQGLDVSEEDRAFVTDHFTLSVLGHVCQWLATGMSADPFLLTERISRVLRGQVRRALTLFAEDPSSSAPRG